MRDATHIDLILDNFEACEGRKENLTNSGRTFACRDSFSAHSVESEKIVSVLQRGRLVDYDCHNDLQQGHEHTHEVC